MGERQPPLRDQITADERGRYPVHPEWISQATLINVGLIVLGIYLVSTLIGVGASDLASRIGVVSFAISLPLLSVLSMLIELQRTRRYASYPWYLVAGQAIGQGAAALGFGAALWHVWYPASIALVVSATIALFIYQAYYRRLDRDNRPERAHRTSHKQARD